MAARYLILKILVFSRQEELEFKIETKTDCSPEVIEEFKDLCEKMEEDENTIRALLSLIDDVKKKKDINFIVLLVNDILNLNVRFVHYDVPELGSPNYVRCGCTPFISLGKHIG